MKVLPYLALLAIPALSLSCKNNTSSGYDDPYVSNTASDGGYNPYPTGGGYVTPPLPDMTQYEAPPMAADEYAFDAPPKPAPKTSTTQKTSSSQPKAKSSRTHTVVRGDTLYGLARKYGSSVAKIKSANGLSSDLIRVGQKVKIP